MTDGSIHLPAWQHAFREQLAEMSGVADAGSASLDPEVDAGLLAGVSGEDLSRAYAEIPSPVDDPEADALLAEIERRGKAA